MKCPIDKSHRVIKQTILNKTYNHCKECCEDIALLNPKVKIPQMPKTSDLGGSNLFLKSHTNFPLPDEINILGSLLRNWYNYSDYDVYMLTSEWVKGGEILVKSYVSSSMANKDMKQVRGFLNGLKIEEPLKSFFISLLELR